MPFRLLDFDQWERKPYFEHYTQNVVCAYSLTVNLDIGGLAGYRLYPAMLWLLTDTVNELPEFRTALTAEGVGVYDDMHPSYTVFNPETHRFSVIWTAFSPDYPAFLHAYEKDVRQYAQCTQFMPKADKPPNTFDVSMLPWTAFSSCHIQVFGDGKHLLPIFTMGKVFPSDGRKKLPLAIQVHHAVCDGYHVGVFADRLQEKIDRFASAASIVPEHGPAMS